LCTFFGWENCSGSILIDRGASYQTLLNQDSSGSTLFKGLKLIHREKTEFQEMRVYDSYDMGRVLCLDNEIQIADQLVDNYSADLSRLIVQKGERYGNLLIIGAGDMVVPGYLLNEPEFNIGKITVVEIDEKVFSISQKFFKSFEKVQQHISSGKLEVVFADGATFLQSRKKEGITYDGIIVDNTDVYEGPSASLFTSDFYRNIHDCLKNGAAFSQQLCDEKVKARWETLVKGGGFSDLSYVYSKTPEYSVSLPIGSGKKIS